MDDSYSRAPQWVRDAVFYQILVDRFENSTTENDDENVVEWGSDPTLNDWMGGDLNGIRKRWDYLTDLGVTALYLTPIFTCTSYHGYDTVDYYQVDPRFGTNDDLKALVAEAHERGIKVLLDGVFNHVSDKFFAFQDLLEKQDQSEYKDWFRVHKFPIDQSEGQETYDDWDGIGSMPALNVTNQATQDYLLDVLRYWINEAGIDGWRLDAANRLDHGFIKAVRAAVKEVCSECYLLAEVWTEAQEYVNGDECDGVMNYPLRGMIADFVNGEMTPSDMEASLCHIIESYPPFVADAMLNMISSHDVERIQDRCAFDPLKVGQAALIQLTFPGAPCIYYGDEIGMRGGKDPDNRRAIMWDSDEWDMGLLEFHKKLIWLRREKDCFHLGSFRTVFSFDDQGLLAYMKESGSTQALVLFNKSADEQTAQISLDSVGTDPFTDWLETGIEARAEDGNLLVTIPAHGMALLGRG